MSIKQVIKRKFFIPKKTYFLALMIVVGSVCFGQTNYYKLSNDSIYDQRDFDSKLKKNINRLPPAFILTPTIYHKQIIKDSIINYVIFLASKKDPNKTQQNIDLVFKQDSLFLLLNKKLPDFSLKDLNGKEFKSSQLLGKPTLLCFWSINCGPCIEEFPQLNKLKEKYGNKVNFISISEDTKEEALSLLKRKPFSFYQLIDGYYYKSHILKITSIPRNIFLDKYCIVREINEGLPYENDEKTGKAVIKSYQPFDKIIDRLIKL